MKNSVKIRKIVEWHFSNKADFEGGLKMLIPEKEKRKRLRKLNHVLIGDLDRKTKRGLITKIIKFEFFK